MAEGVVDGKGGGIVGYVGVGHRGGQLGQDDQAGDGRDCGPRGRAADALQDGGQPDGGEHGAHEDAERSQSGGHTDTGQGSYTVIGEAPGCGRATSQGAHRQ